MNFFKKNMDMQGEKKAKNVKKKGEGVFFIEKTGLNLSLLQK